MLNLCLKVQPTGYGRLAFNFIFEEQTFMPTHFATVVEQVQNLSSVEKIELKSLLERYLIEERREEIYQNYLASQRQHQKKPFEFSSDMAQLKEMLDE
jgi:hypothetical protein